MSNNIFTENGTNKLRRSRDDRMLAGVCGGWAKLLGIDAALLRILLTIGTIFSFGTGALIYLVCWILMPEQE